MWFRKKEPSREVKALLWLLEQDKGWTFSGDDWTQHELGVVIYPNGRVLLYNSTFMPLTLAERLKIALKAKEKRRAYKATERNKESQQLITTMQTWAIKNGYIKQFDE